LAYLKKLAFWLETPKMKPYVRYCLRKKSVLLIFAILLICVFGNTMIKNYEKSNNFEVSPFILFLELKIFLRNNFRLKLSKLNGLIRLLHDTKAIFILNNSSTFNQTEIFKIELKTTPVFERHPLTFLVRKDVLHVLIDQVF
jgi:hypothetical protein